MSWACFTEGLEMWTEEFGFILSRVLWGALGGRQGELEHGGHASGHVSALVLTCTARSQGAEVESGNTRCCKPEGCRRYTLSHIFFFIWPKTMRNQFTTTA